LKAKTFIEKMKSTSAYSFFLVSEMLYAQVNAHSSIKSVNSMSDMPKYWFPAKRYGWGWGLPSTWQGWIVLVGYLFLMMTGITIIGPKFNTINYVIYTAVLTAIFIIICWRVHTFGAWRCCRKSGMRTGYWRQEAWRRGESGT